MTTTESTQAAHRHIAAARSFRLQLEEEYARTKQDRAVIADLHQQVGFALAIAKVYAELATAEAITALRVTLDKRLGLAS